MPKDIRSRRQALRIKLKGLARAAGVSPGDLSKWERGLEEVPVTTMARIARALGCDPVDLDRAQRRTARAATPGEGYTTAKPGVAEKVMPRRTAVPEGIPRVLDLFCGAGGFSYGLEQTGRFAVTCGIDLLPDRIETFTRNHPHATGIVADIRSFSIDRLASESLRPDVLIGGPPCQGFSSIRPFRTLTEGDPRNSLLEHFILVASHVRPKWVVLENVVGLLTHAQGTVLRDVLNGLQEVGYKTEWRVLNGANHGLPQNRERLVVVGNRDGTQFEWPLPTRWSDHRSMAGKYAERVERSSLFHGTLPPAVTVMEAIHDLPPVSAGRSANFYLDDVDLTDYERDMRRGAEVLTMHEATSHTERMLAIIRRAGTNRSALPDGMTTSGFSTSYSRLDADKPSVTLTVNFVHPASNKCIHPYQDRALTLREGARLQGFPDRFVFCGNRAHLAKQIGNAVPPVLGRVIGEALAAAMENSRPRSAVSSCKIDLAENTGSDPGRHTRGRALPSPQR